MFLTPITYPATMISQSFHRIYSLNPMVAVVNAFRNALLGAPLDIVELWKASAVAAAILMAGLYVFARMEKKFAYLL